MSDDQEKAGRDWRIPEELWERIQRLLPPRKPHPLGCHRPRVDERTAMDAIVFVLRTGCPWNALNETGLCSSRAAPRRFQEWTAAEVCLGWWQHGLAAYDALKGMDWAWLAREGAMTKAPLGGQQVGQNPTARGKGGPKRRVRTDGGGLPIGLAGEGAHRHDVKMARATMTSIPLERPAPTPEPPQGMCLDKGYDDEVRDLLTECGFTAHLRARGEEVHAIKQEAGYKARRWVVERPHRGMNRFHRVLSRWDKQVCNYLAFLHLACAYITYRQSGLLG